MQNPPSLTTAAIPSQPEQPLTATALPITLSGGLAQPEAVKEKANNFLDDMFRRRLFTLLGYTSFTILLSLSFFVGDKFYQTGFVILAVVCLCLTEPIPYHVICLIPLVLFPLAGTLTAEVVSDQYLSSEMLRTVSCLFISILAHVSHVSHRVALRFSTICGANIRLNLLMFMACSCLLSTIISCTATCAIMAAFMDYLINEIIESRGRVRASKFVVQDPLTPQEQSEKVSKSGRSANKNKDSKTGVRKESSVPGEIGQKASNNNAKGNAPINVALGSSAGLRGLPYYVSNEPISQDEQQHQQRLRKTFCLGLLYSVALGGMITLNDGLHHRINTHFTRFYNEKLYDTWFLALFHLIYAVLGLLVAWNFLSFVYLRGVLFDPVEDYAQFKEALLLKSIQIGPWSLTDHILCALYMSTIFIWATRMSVFGGWIQLLKKHTVTETTIGFFIVVVAFLIPSDLQNFELRNRILKWNDIYHRMPWGVIFTMGGTQAVSTAITKNNGLDAVVNWARKFPSNSTLTYMMFMLVTGLFSEVMLEETQNQMFFTVINSTMHEKIGGMDSAHLPLDVYMCVCSAIRMTFCLPSSSGPAAIIFEVSQIAVLDMALSGVVIKLAFIVIYGTLMSSLGIKALIRRKEIEMMMTTTSLDVTTTEAIASIVSNLTTIAAAANKSFA